MWWTCKKCDERANISDIWNSCDVEKGENKDTFKKHQLQNYMYMKFENAKATFLAFVIVTFVTQHENTYARIVVVIFRMVMILYLHKQKFIVNSEFGNGF